MASDQHKILYVFNKQSQYPRIKLIRRALEAFGHVDTISSERNTYFARTVEILFRYFFRKRRDHDLLVIGFFAQLLFPFLRLFWRKPIVVDCFISLYDSYVCDRKMAPPGSLRAKICYHLDRSMLLRADAVLADTDQHASYFAEFFAVSESKFRAVPVSSDSKVFPYLQPHLGDGRLKQTKVLYFGTYIPLHGVDTIIHAAKLLKDKPVDFLLLGDGQTYSEQLRLTEELRLKNVHFNKLFTIEEIVSQSEKSHILLGIFGATDKAKRVIPNKVFDALSMGRPVITGDSPAIRQFFNNGENIFLVPFSDPEALAEKIMEIASDYPSAQATALAGHEVFTRELSAKQVNEVIARLLGEIFTCTKEK